MSIAEGASILKTEEYIIVPSHMLVEKDFKDLNLIFFVMY
jgi:hypothetical protein